MTDNTTSHTLPAWTEVEYTAPCLSPYLSTPVFLPKATRYFLCREDGSRKEARLSFTVFKSAGAPADTEWEDDPMVGELLVNVLGDGDEEVEPVRAVYLGTEPERFVSVVGEDDRTITFAFRWRFGEVSVEKATHTSEGWTLRKDDFTDQGIRCTLTPRRGEPFHLYLQIPYLGFSLTDEKGNKLMGDIEILPHQADLYDYAFVGDDQNDRFSIVLDGGHLTYLCVLRDGGSLAVRDQRNRLAEVCEIPAAGKLSELLMGAHTALVKNKDRRWNISLGLPSNAVDDSFEVSAIGLVRHAFTLFSQGEDEEKLASRLLLLENKCAFQWFWLTDADWSHDHLEGLLDLEGLDQDPEKMMRMALLYNRFEQFMVRLCALSYVAQKPLQGDHLQARNNKRKIARCARAIQAHRQGELDLWSLSEDERREILTLFSTFHREFTAELGD